MRDSDTTSRLDRALAIAGTQLWQTREYLIAAGIAALAIAEPAAAAAATIALADPTRPWGRHQLHTGHVRRQWTRACIRAGLTDPPPDRAHRARTHVGPRATTVRQTPLGDELTVTLPTGYGPLEKNADRLRDELGAIDVRTRYTPHPTDRRRWDRRGRGHVTIVHRDPFHNLPPTRSPLTDATHASVWDPTPWGLDEHHNPIALTTMGNGHAIVAGMTRSGKSVGVRAWLAQATLDPTAHLILLDPNVAMLALWRPAASIFIDSDIHAATRALQTIRGLIDTRAQQLAETGQVKIGPGDATYHIFIEEAAHYLAHENPDARDEFRRTLLNLAQRGAFVGVRIIIIMQRPAAEIIDTSIRAQLGAARIAYRLDNAASTRMMFETADVTPHEIPRLNHQGVNYAWLDDGTVTRTRSHNITDDDVRAIVARAPSRTHPSPSEAKGAGGPVSPHSRSSRPGSRRRRRPPRSPDAGQRRAGPPVAAAGTRAAPGAGDAPAPGGGVPRSDDSIPVPLRGTGGTVIVSAEPGTQVLTERRHAILSRLAASEPATAVTIGASRDELRTFEARGWVVFAGTAEPTGPGRPANLWRITDVARRALAEARVPA